MAIDESNLSSNWKALQEKLGAGSRSRTTGQPYNSKPTSQRKPLNPNNDLPNSVSTPLKRKCSTTATMTTTDIMTTTTTATTIEPTSAPIPPTTTEPPKSGKHIALDTEMVGTYQPPPHSLPPSRRPPHTYSILARVSLVNYELQKLYDAYVLPPPDTPIDDYRTQYSGITAWHLDPSNTFTNPKPFAIAQKEVSDLLLGRVLIGHDLPGDLAVLGLSHPKRDIRDTALLPKFRAKAGGAPALGLSRREGGLGRKDSAANVRVRERGGTSRWFKPSLRSLASDVLGWEIQKGEKGHDSVEDAKAAMALFRREKGEFEREIVKRFGVKRGSEGRKDGKSGTAAEGAKANGIDEDAGRPLGSDDEDEGDEENEEADEGVKAKPGAAMPASGKAKRKTKKKKGKYRRGGG